VEIQEQTFQHISREIHDHINHSLTLAKLNLVTAGPGNIQKMSEAINSSVTILGSVITDLNNLSKSIHTEKIREMGLVTALNMEINNLTKMAGLEIDYEIKGEPVFLDSEKELVIFRIIQEAFNNIIKHSKATKIRLELNYSGHYLDLLIRDNGIGFDQDVCSQKGNNHSGLKNMETRAKIFGGNFVLYSRPEKGTQIIVSIPYRS
jgi:signal transduction histidine kinase